MFETHTSHPPPNSVVLVVDDEPKNIQVVGSILLKHGHEIIAAQSAQEALLKLQSIQPDIILLDVMMPEMCGIELCKILKKSPKTHDIPVIFISAATDKNIITQGLNHGGVDYITKPFHGPELVSRVELHSKLRKSLRSLDDAVAEQKRLLEIVAHDLKNPLSGIHLATSMLKEQFGNLGERHEQLLASIQNSSIRAFDIVASLLQTAELEALKTNIQTSPICLLESTHLAVTSLDHQIQRKSITVRILNNRPTTLVIAEHRSLKCCLENLISNAIKFSPPGSIVTIEVNTHARHGECVIHDQGPGVPAAERSLLFRKFSRLSNRPTGGETSTGLGLHIVRELATAMLGSVKYLEKNHAGACFSLRIPLAPPAPTPSSPFLS
jgi:two-component system sensor histidine kinase/response regulator